MVLEKPELLKEWLITTLRKMCDADPIALGKYILALVKKDKKDLKSFLLEQLEVFLLHDTSRFVELLIETLRTKSYLKPADSASVSPVTSSHQHTSKADSTDISKDKNVQNTKSIHDLSVKASSRSPEKNSHKRKNIFDDQLSRNKKEPYTPSSSKDAVTNSSKEEYVPTACKTVSQEIKYKPSSKKIKLCDTLDGKEESPVTHVPLKSEIIASYSTKQSTRCKDYDEKGYCLRGNFCGFDHGNDPILVENSPDQFLTNLKSVNFGVNISPDGTSTPPLPPLPTSPPRIPPPPPPPPPPDFAEPYNPESPGMNLVQPYFNVSKPPPPLPPIVYNSSVGMSNVHFGKNAVYNKPKEGRFRELINVESSNLSNRESSRPPQAAQRRFDFSRLGPCPRTTLEIRKIPSQQNTIKNLYQHFSKFGSIVNMEVPYDNDPEAALVTFSTNSEATTAYRSTEAILQNRFIKVFWNNDGQNRRINPYFLKEISDFLPSHENSKNVPSNEDNVFEEKLVEKDNENHIAPKANPRTVFVSKPNHEINRKVFTKSTVKKGIEQEDITAHKFKLHQAKTELLNRTVKDQKLILDQLVKATKNQKEFLKKALDSISKRVEELTKELKKENEELKTFLKCPSQVPDPKNATKELLDAELELYKKQHTNSDEDTTELLLKKVNFMKSRAKALGLIQPRRGKSVFRRKINTRYSLSVDHRTTKILVSGTDFSEKEDLRRHFMQFGGIEKLEDAAEGLLVSFYNRPEAEQAYFHGAKFKNRNLSLSWFNDTQMNVNSASTFEEKEQTMDEMQSIDDEEEDEEEDSEARSWRR